ALATFAQGLQDAFVAQSIVHPTLRYGQRGRSGPGTPPGEVVYQRDGALAMRLAARQAGIDPQSCFILATNELDAALLSPKDLFPVKKTMPTQSSNTFSPSFTPPPPCRYAAVAQH